MASFEEQAARLDVKGIIITMVLSAFGFLVALTWRDVIQATIDTFIQPSEDLFYSYLAAIIVTGVAIVVTYILVRLEKIDIIHDQKPKKKRRKNQMPLYNRRLKPAVCW